MAGGFPTYQNFTGVTNGTSVGTAIVLDWTVVPFNVSFALELISGTGNFGVQYTLDDVNAAQFCQQGNQLATPVYATTTVTWFPDANVGTTGTASASGNYAFPVRALRCVVSSASSINLQFVVIQGMQQI